MIQPQWFRFEAESGSCRWRGGRKLRQRRQSWLRVHGNGRPSFGFQSRVSVRELATGKWPEPVDWKACAAADTQFDFGVRVESGRGGALPSLRSCGQASRRSRRHFPPPGHPLRENISEIICQSLPGNSRVCRWPGSPTAFDPAEEIHRGDNCRQPATKPNV